MYFSVSTPLDVCLSFASQGGPYAMSQHCINYYFQGWGSVSAFRFTFIPRNNRVAYKSKSECAYAAPTLEIVVLYNAKTSHRVLPNSQSSDKHRAVLLLDYKYYKYTFGNIVQILVIFDGVQENGIFINNSNF